jgi:hypothetical protein
MHERRARHAGVRNIKARVLPVRQRGA